MAWYVEGAPGHEGYVVGLVREGGLAKNDGFRELAYPVDDRDLVAGEVLAFQAACDCGWRSPRFWAPPGAKWHPFSLQLGHEDLEEDARALWRGHALGEARARYARLRPAKP